MRLPIVVINPDDDVEYGRKESRFFPAGLKPDAQEGKHKGELPNTPPAGAYYIEGAAGAQYQTGFPLTLSCSTTHHLQQMSWRQLIHPLNPEINPSMFP